MDLPSSQSIAVLSLIALGAYAVVSVGSVSLLPPEWCLEPRQLREVAQRDSNRCDPPSLRLDRLLGRVGGQ
jgi:hypothetical protein